MIIQKRQARSMSKVDQITQDQINIGMGLSKIAVTKKKPAKKQKIEEEPVVEEKVIESIPAEVFTLDETVSKFSHLPICDKLKEILSKEGFDILTKIQREAIP